VKILIAPDSFKNALTSIDVSKSLQKGLSKNLNLDISIQQLSDGGEGALEVILEDYYFERETIITTNPIGKKINASYALDKTHGKAFIEIAQSAGLELLSNEDKNPLFTTTYGVGKIILDAYKKGIRDFTLSLGGSATNDGGAGILSALGVKFIGANKKQISNSDLINIESINIDNIIIKNCRFKLLVDVDNPLLGDNGATRIYSTQKGARDKDLFTLENNLTHFANIISEFTSTNYSNYKGSGAAGGIAFGLKSFFDVEIISGFEEFASFCGLEKQILETNLVISGEGSLDSQSQNGKLISGIADICFKHNKPFILVAGKVEDIDLEYYFRKGCKAIIPIQDKNQLLDESIARTSEMLENVGEEISNFIDFLKL